jgi:hypothetical protein
LDLVGVGLLTLGLLGVVFGLIEGQRYDWGTVTGWIGIWMIIGAGAAMLAIFGWRQVRMQNSEPLVPFDIFHDRTYTVMTFVLLAMGFAMVGVFLPLTIFYQSVLGLSAVAAGVVIGTQSLAMMITSGIVGGAGGSGKLNLKWVLFAGLLLFGLGVGYMALVAEPNASRWSFVPGLVVAGIGMGSVWTPLFGLATQDMAPSRAGVAAGVLDTMQEFGTVLATAILGAVLANRIAAAMPGQIAAAAANLPGSARSGFVSGLSQAASGGIEVGAGQAANVALPAGTPADVVAQIHAAAQQAFAGGFTEAMRPTMIVPIVVVVLAAGAVLFVRGGKPAPHPVELSDPAGLPVPASNQA